MNTGVETRLASISRPTEARWLEYGTAYAASKFGVVGWMESLAPALEPFGINTTIVNPTTTEHELRLGIPDS